MSDAAPPSEARSGPGRVAIGRSPTRVAVAALALFGCLAILIAHHPRTALDDVVRAWVIAVNRPAAVAFFAFVSTVGSVTPMIIYAVIIIALAAILRRSMVPLTVLLAPLVAVFAYLGTKSIFVRTRPSGVGNAFEGTYSFPSAHATTSSAVCGAMAYLLYREGLLSGVTAVTGAAIICLLVGISRVYLDVHWATDVLGGWFLGTAIGATASALYESAGGPAARRH